MQGIVALCVPIVAIVMGSFLLMLIRKFENDERMAMIEKGITIPQKESFRVNPASALRWGFLLFGIGTGLFIASFLDNGSIRNPEPLYPALVLIFGGLGLLASYLVQLKLDQRKRD